jgi:glucokinase
VNPRLAIGIDIGGTKVAGGVVDVDGNVIYRARRDTPARSKSPAVVEGTIVEVVTELIQIAGPGTVAAVGPGDRRLRPASVVAPRASPGGPAEAGGGADLR